MRKTFVLVILFCMGAVISFGQLKNTDEVKKQLETRNKDTTAWIYGGVVNVGLNEGFLHNWAAGGEIASMNVNGIFNGFVTHLHKREVWSNNLDLNYGLNYAYSNSFIPRKTDDRIDFTSKYGYRLDTNKDIYFTGLVNFKSQFTHGYDYSLPSWQNASNSKFLSPAYFTLGLGWEYRKGTDISLFVSPATARLTIADQYYTRMTPAGAFGIPYGKKSFMAFGAYFSGRYMINISKKSVFSTRLDMYANYLAKDRFDANGMVIKDNPGNVSWLWDNLYSYKVSRYLNITIGATAIYDNNIPYVKPATAPSEVAGQGLGWVQLKQIFSIGFEYKF